MLDFAVKIIEAPETVRNSGQHCSRRPEFAGMAALVVVPCYPNEVVVRVIDCGRSFQILQFFGESQRQPSESTNKCTDRQIVSLNVARANRSSLMLLHTKDRTIGRHHFRRSVRQIRVAVFLDDRVLPANAPT